MNEIFLISNWISGGGGPEPGRPVGTLRYIIFVWVVIEKHKKRITGLTRISRYILITFYRRKK